MNTPASSSADLPDTKIYAEEIQTEQVKIIFRHLGPLLFINAVVATALVFALWSVVSRELLVSWLVAMFVVLGLRAALYVAYRRPASDPTDKIWRTGFAAGSAAAGATWGIGGALLFPSGSLEYQLLVLFILVGMGAGAVTSLTAYMPAFYAFLPASLLPVAVLLLRMNDPIHIALGVLAVLYVVGLSFFAHTINNALVESLSLRFQNIDLVRELSEQRDEAERANVGKSQFLAAASHDLRQPLHALTLFTSALDERIRYPEVRRIVDNISASVRALERLFNALLDISRLDAGVLQPEIRHFRLENVLRRLVNDYAPNADAKKLALVCDPCDIVVRSDPALLERILRNYVSNAIRYTAKGEVRITGTTTADTVRIDVSDTGIGIPTRHQREIFNEFYQLGNPERDRAKGLGLGLAIVDRVARLLNHPISVESTPGNGARFAVEVPLGDTAQIVREAPPESMDMHHDLAGLCVVVVDDEVGVRQGMRTLFEQWGCVVVTAGSEDEAIAAARAADRAPDVAIVDYRLRDGRTGDRKTAARVRQSDPGVDRHRRHGAGALARSASDQLSVGAQTGSARGIARVLA